MKKYFLSQFMLFLCLFLLTTTVQALPPDEKNDKSTSVKVSARLKKEKKTAEKEEHTINTISESEEEEEKGEETICIKIVSDPDETDEEGVYSFLDLDPEEEGRKEAAMDSVSDWDEPKEEEEGEECKALEKSSYFSRKQSKSIQEKREDLLGAYLRYYNDIKNGEVSLYDIITKLKAPLHSYSSLLKPSASKFKKKDIKPVTDLYRKEKTFQVIKKKTSLGYKAIL